MNLNRTVQGYLNESLEAIQQRGQITVEKGQEKMVPGLEELIATSFAFPMGLHQ